MKRRRLAHGLMAEFRGPDELVAAVAALRALGYRELETFTPFAVPGLTERLGLPWPALPKFVLLGGILGGIAGYLIQWYSDVVAYVQIVGGRPAHAVPAFIPATFEATVLGASLTAFFGLYFVLGLPALWHPVFEVEGFDRASDDRFWLAVSAEDPIYDRERTGQALAALGPLRVTPVPERTAPAVAVPGELQ
ncbi:MAG TPA: DUF3341 domain-containing protein [Gemmatimonadales bacterium]|nr:DUF3341 domain-containing protein [Gemmatimonadales bacterium]